MAISKCISLSVEDKIETSCFDAALHVNETGYHGTPEFPVAIYLDDVSQQYVNWHWHEEFEIGFVTKGSVTLGCGNRKYRLECGDIFFVKPASPDLVSLLQAYFNRRNAGAYSQKAKLNNLKEMNLLFNYLMDNGIHDLDTLEERVNAMQADYSALKEKLDTQTSRMKEIRELPQCMETYHNLKPIHDALQKIKFTRAKEKYKTDHAVELKQFYAVQRKLTEEFPDGKFDRHKLDSDYTKLEQEHEETYTKFKSLRTDSQQLWKIKSYVDSARKDLEQIQQYTSRKQEQEI